ncbi:MAG: tetratricopeptide repeat protein [Planctomycetota bacterium]
MFRFHALSVLVFLALAAIAPPVPAQEATVLERARALKDEGEYEKAAGLLADAIEKSPKDFDLLLEMGMVSHLKARETLAENASLGRLALYDARGWYEKALALKPESVPALQLSGQVSVELQDWKAGAETWRRAAELAPDSGESFYQLGYCLALSNRFEKAIEAFREASRRLGPDPRILLNQGISHASLEETAEARRCFEALVRGEIEADRRRGRHMNRGVFWLWKIHSDAADWEGAEEVFGRLAKDHPDVSSAHWYLGHARSMQRDAVGAAQAFARVTEIVPTWTDGWLKLGSTLTRAKEYGAAEDALRAAAKLDPEGQGPQDLLFEIGLALKAEGRSGDAAAMVTRLLDSFEGDALVLEFRGDLFFQAGDAKAALADYRQVVATDPFAGEAVVKAEKAVTALLRRGEPATRAETAPRKKGEGGTILDFERPEVYVRVASGVEAGRRSGRFTARRTGSAEEFANVTVSFVPTLDSRPYAWLRFDVKGPKGSTIVLRARDGYDEWTERLGSYRTVHETAVELVGEWQTVTLPMAGFASRMEHRPLSFQPSRLRTLAFQLGEPGGTEKKLADEIALDNVTLVPDEGDALVLTDFERTPGEMLFVTDGAGVAFARTLFTEEQLRTFVPDPNTYVTPEIFRDAFDPAMVHGGRGSFRMTAVRDGAASGVLSFNPDRSFEKAGALVFFARGAKGGEKLRVTIEDAMDEDLVNPAPASAPRHVLDGRILEGWYSLSPEWRPYRIDRAEFPDVDFRSLLRIRFHYGTTEGNATGTVIWLDDVTWE